MLIFFGMGRSREICSQLINRFLEQPLILIYIDEARSHVTRASKLLKEIGRNDKTVRKETLQLRLAHRWELYKAKRHCDRKYFGCQNFGKSQDPDGTPLFYRC